MKIITTEDAAKLLGVKAWSIRKWLRDGKLNGRKISPKQWLVFDDYKLQEVRLKRQLIGISEQFKQGVKDSLTTRPI